MEFVTLKAPKRTVKRINYLQSVLTFREGRNVPKSEVIAKAVDLLDAQYVEKKEPKSSFSAIFGIAKGGGPSNADDIDEVVYGDPYGDNHR